MATPEITLSRDGSRHVTDERINTITSMVGALLSLLGVSLLGILAYQSSDIWKMIAAGVYGFGLLSLFVMSALHHGINASPTTNMVLRKLDYISIFVLIAATTTPLVLVRGRNLVGWAVLAVLWSVAALGITLVASLHHLPRHISNTFFIVMGWMPVVLLAVSSMHLPLGGLALLTLGGLVYSVGFVVYTTERPNPLPGVFGFHELWHSLILVAALAHFMFMFHYIV